MSPNHKGSALTDLVAPDWAEALEPVAAQITAMSRFLREETAAGRGYLPPGEAILRAFAEPMANVKVIIAGQDPYPTPGHSMGLSFSVAPDIRSLPRSLVNIFRELDDDLQIHAARSGDLSPWARQGVLLLNRVLTVQPGITASHRGKGWEVITGQAIRALLARKKPLVALLWGREAQKLKPMLGGIPTIESAHPSPLSASRGFFGSRPFSRINQLLAEQGVEPIDWALPR